ncbi:hypothetical protein E0E52_12735, partial [Azotobacter chroococcum]
MTTPCRNDRILHLYLFGDRQKYTKPIESIVILRDNTPMKCKRNSDGRAIDHHSLQVMRQQAIKA